MREKSFLEILSQRIENDLKKEIFPSENSDFPSEKMSQNTKNGTFSSEKSPSSLEYELNSPWISSVFKGKIHFFEGSQQAQKQTLRRAYPEKPKPKVDEKRVPHQLSEEQNQAWNYFLNWKTGLTLDFTEKELKGVFRKLAHKLHPDRNAGNSHYYLELKKNYDTLSRVFKVSHS
jgi:hypothetical protein